MAPARFRLKPNQPEVGFTRLELVKRVIQIYMRVYKTEAATTRVPVGILGGRCISCNRNATDGKCRSQLPLFSLVELISVNVQPGARDRGSHPPHRSLRRGLERDEARARLVGRPGRSLSSSSRAWLRSFMYFLISLQREPKSSTVRDRCVRELEREMDIWRVQAFDQPERSPQHRSLPHSRSSHLPRSSTGCGGDSREAKVERVLSDFERRPLEFRQGRIHLPLPLPCDFT